MRHHSTCLEERRGGEKGEETLLSARLQRSGVAPNAFVGCTLLSQLSAAKSMDVERFLRWRRRAPNQRYAVLASLARLRLELYARQAKRARLAYAEAAEEDEEEEVLEEQAGALLTGCWHSISSTLTTCGCTFWSSCR